MLWKVWRKKEILFSGSSYSSRCHTSEWLPMTGQYCNYCLSSSSYRELGTLEKHLTWTWMMYGCFLWEIISKQNTKELTAGKNCVYSRTERQGGVAWEELEEKGSYTKISITFPIVSVWFLIRIWRYWSDYLLKRESEKGGKGKQGTDIGFKELY